MGATIKKKEQFGGKMLKKEIKRGFQEDCGFLKTPLLFKVKRWKQHDSGSWQSVPVFHNTHGFFVEDGLAFAVFCRCALLWKSWGAEWDQLGEDVELVKPFIIWHITVLPSIEPSLDFECWLSDLMNFKWNKFGTVGWFIIEEFPSIAYSRRGSTMGLNRGVMALSESLENEWRAIISIRLAYSQHLCSALRSQMLCKEEPQGDEFYDGLFRGTILGSWPEVYTTVQI